jgi:hypothetical protein
MTGFLAIFCSLAGLVFWPTFQIVHRRWSSRARRLCIVFLVTLFALASIGVAIEVTGTGHYLVPMMWLFPLINFMSLAASVLVCMITPKERPISPR